MYLLKIFLKFLHFELIVEIGGIAEVILDFGYQDCHLVEKLLHGKYTLDF